MRDTSSILLITSLLLYISAQVSISQNIADSVGLNAEMGRQTRKSASNECSPGTVVNYVAPSNHTNRITTNYDINKGKSIAKKLKACNRDVPIRIQSTGGGLRLFMQSGAYEILRPAIDQFYRSSNGIYSSNVTEKADGKGHIVSIVYQIYEKAADKHAYTVNLYHTTSSILLNGSDQESFINNDLQRIISLCHGSDMERMRSMNITIKNALIKLRSESVSTSQNCPPTSSTAKCIMSDTGDVNCCPICFSRVHGGIECTNCCTCFHTKCIGMSRAEYRNVTASEGIPFSCLFCIADQEIDGTGTLPQSTSVLIDDDQSIPTTAQSTSATDEDTHLAVSQPMPANPPTSDVNLRNVTSPTTSDTSRLKPIAGAQPGGHIVQVDLCSNSQAKQSLETPNTLQGGSSVREDTEANIESSRSIDNPVVVSEQQLDSSHAANKAGTGKANPRKGNPKQVTPVSNVSRPINPSSGAMSKEKLMAVDDMLRKDAARDSYIYIS